MRMRRVALLSAILGVLAGFYPLAKPLTVAANESCVQQSNGSYACTYTQLENNFTDGAGDPDCHNQCAWYQKNGHGSSMSYSYANLVNQMHAGNINFPAWMDKAVQAWSGQPYNNPIFYNCHCSSGQFLTVGNLQYNYPGTNNVDTTHCGVGDSTTAWDAYGSTNDNHIVSAYADYNVRYSGYWVDDQNNTTHPVCSTSGTAFHEVGHATGEGHSTASLSEIMYSVNGSAGTNTDKVDGDAQALLNVLYGPYENNDSGTDSGGCHNCQMACTQVQAGTTADGLQTINQALWTICGTSYTLPSVWGYYAKLWDLTQSVAVVPSTDGIEALVLGGNCATYFLSKQLLPWLNCVAPID